ncbi:hypothetical protein PCANC_28163 [Puccinia coronata f. sp. avenae]|uniref:Uncharacterized protein n=1 Tax=Puccinia coronata f. sp. avenae TaxID=200324 RepID=A0A2N5TJP3_9BASI|nr:hypothetical protein PCANC_28163 [Puccinia coronata f. sp. avenae]
MFNSTFFHRRPPSYDYHSTEDINQSAYRPTEDINLSGNADPHQSHSSSYIAGVAPPGSSSQWDCRPMTLNYSSEMHPVDHMTPGRSSSGQQHHYSASWNQQLMDNVEPSPAQTGSYSRQPIQAQPATRGTYQHAHPESQVLLHHDHRISQPSSQSIPTIEPRISHSQTPQSQNCHSYTARGTHRAFHLLADSQARRHPTHHPYAPPPSNTKQPTAPPLQLSQLPNVDDELRQALEGPKKSKPRRSKKNGDTGSTATTRRRSKRNENPPIAAPSAHLAPAVSPIRVPCLEITDLDFASLEGLPDGPLPLPIDEIALANHLHQDRQDNEPLPIEDFNQHPDDREDTSASYDPAALDDNAGVGSNPIPGAPVEFGHPETGASSTTRVEQHPRLNRTNKERSEEGPKSTRKRLSPLLMEEIRGLDLDELRQRVATHAHYVRLDAHDKLELDEVYNEFQRQVYVITLKNLLHDEAVMNYLAIKNRSRGSTMYNNFCQYDPEASAIKNDKSIKIQRRWSLCGALWRKLDKTTQIKFKDPNFLKTLPNPFPPIEETNQDNNHDLQDDVAKELAEEIGVAEDDIAGRVSEANTVENNTNTTEHNLNTEEPNTNSVERNVSNQKKPRKWIKPNQFDASAWARKVIVDMSNFANSYGVEGYLVVCYPHKNGRAVHAGGSRMGEAFLDMFAVDPNPAGGFLDFVRGQRAISKVLGREAPLPVTKRKRNVTENDLKKCPYTKGGLSENVDEIRKQLRHALFEATNGTWIKGWPGKNTKETLKKLNVSLQVKPNEHNIKAHEFCKELSRVRIGHTHRLLTALAEGCVVLKTRVEGEESNNESVGEHISEDGDEINVTPVGPIVQTLQNKTATKSKKAATKKSTETRSKKANTATKKSTSTCAKKSSSATKRSTLASAKKAQGSRNEIVCQVKKPRGKRNQATDSSSEEDDTPTESSEDLDWNEEDESSDDSKSDEGDKSDQEGGSDEVIE